jgi:hypothetical protein
MTVASACGRSQESLMMNEILFCDFCGRSAEDVPPASGDDESPALQLDEDDLWVCRICRERIVTPPVGDEVTLDLPDELRALVGKSAGHIVLTLNLPGQPPYEEIVADADRLHNVLMSEWAFISQWPDGTTVWREPDGPTLALVTRDGSVLRVSQD